VADFHIPLRGQIEERREEREERGDRNEHVSPRASHDKLRRKTRHRTSDRRRGTKASPNEPNVLI